MIFFFNLTIFPIIFAIFSLFPFLVLFHFFLISIQLRDFLTILSHYFHDFPPNFSDSVSALTEVLLVNVMHFKSDWQKSFESETSQEDFQRTRGGPVKVDMMYGDLTNVGYIRTNKAQILAIPFEDENYHMVLVLPSQERGNRGKIFTHTDSKLNFAFRNSVCVLDQFLTENYNFGVKIQTLEL